MKIRFVTLFCLIALLLCGPVSCIYLCFLHTSPQWHLYPGVESMEDDEQIEDEAVSQSLINKEKLYALSIMWV